MTALHSHLRIARPVSDLPRAQAMYCAGLGLRVIGSFEDPDGYRVVLQNAEWRSVETE